MRQYLNLLAGAAQIEGVMLEQAEDFKRWVADGACVYVCGSLKGMAAGVDAALNRMLGEEAVQQLIEDGRYRRDVY